MDISIDSLINDCLDAITKEIKNLKQLNIIVAGKTGVGKSTLVNSVFRDDLAETGIGRPITQRMCEYSKPDLPLHIFDTKGFELGKNSQNEVKEEIFETIRKGVSKNNVNEAIHCIWYCINSTADRIEDEEIEWLQSFAKENTISQVPVIVVLTKSFAKKQSQEFTSYIKSLNLHVAQVVPVLAQDYEVDTDYVVKSYGLDNLVEIMMNTLDDELVKTLMNVQKVYIEGKEKLAHKIVVTSATAAAAAGASPIPFTDAALIVPTQISMLAGITAVFGLELEKAILSTFVTSTLGCGGATVAGTGIANLLKTIPGVGTLAGGAISAGTASILTIALGEAYIKLMVMVANGELKQSDLATDKARNIIMGLFKK